MLSAKENFLETIKPDGKPDRLVKQYEGAVFYPPNPAASYIRGNRHPGMDPLIDRFGTGTVTAMVPATIAAESNTESNLFLFIFLILLLIHYLVS